MSVTYTFPPVSSPCCAEINPIQPYFRRNWIPFAVAAFFRYRFSGFSASGNSILCPFVSLSLFHACDLSFPAFLYPFTSLLTFPVSASSNVPYAVPLAAPSCRTLFCRTILLHHAHSIPLRLRAHHPSSSLHYAFFRRTFRLLPLAVPAVRKRGIKKGVSLSGNTFS